MLLFKDNLQLTPEQTDLELETIRIRGLCRSESSRYEWRFSSIDLRGKYSSGVGSPSSGINFKPFDYFSEQTAAFFDKPVNNQDTSPAHPAFAPFSIGAAVPLPINYLELALNNFPYEVWPGFFADVTQYVRTWIITTQIGQSLLGIPFGACSEITRDPVTDSFSYNETETASYPATVGDVTITWESDTLNVSRQVLADYVAI